MENIASIKLKKKRKTFDFFSSIKRRLISVKQGLKEGWQLYLMLIFPLVYFIVFKYIPMYGVQIAFKDYSSAKGILGSPWVGLKYFIKFINSYNFMPVFLNTLKISMGQLLFSFPFPIILALALNSCRNARFKKTVQFAVYAPYFISVVVMSGIIIQFLDPRLGIINRVFSMITGETMNFMGSPDKFVGIFVGSNIWQNTGWGTIIYLAALADVDSNLHEAAQIDGANRFQRILNIDLPCIYPTIITLLIVNTGRVLNVGFQKVLLLQNPLNLTASEIIQTYTYKVGLASQMANFSYSAAIGLFTGIVNLILLLSVNKISRHFGHKGIF
ncbi:ABC transporter permease subunit (plasmid) [Fusobacteria bacterium ZRK30]|nr:ABC transporter permease subunit [Fusobacteria bacterium ZRK30]